MHDLSPPKSTSVDIYIRHHTTAGRSDFAALLTVATTLIVVQPVRLASIACLLTSDEGGRDRGNPENEEESIQAELTELMPGGCLCMFWAGASK